MNKPMRDDVEARVMNEEAEGYDCGYAWASDEGTFEQIMRALAYRDEKFEHEESLGRGLHLWRIVHGEHSDYTPRGIEDLSVRLIGEEVPSAALMRGFVEGVVMAHTDGDTASSS